MKLSSGGSASSSGIQYPEWVFPNCWAWRQFVHHLGEYTFNIIVPPLQQTKPCFACELRLFWMSALETHSRYFKWKRTWKTLRCVAEFNVRGKSQAVGLELAWNFIPGWVSSLCAFTHVALCSSVLLWPRLLASQFWEENRHPESLTSSPNAMPFPRPVHSKQGGGCMITSSFCYNPMDGVMKAHFLERRYIASKSPNSPNKRITSLVAPATLEFWQAHKYLFWRGDCEGQRSCISDSSWICDQISDPDACHLILRPYAVDLVLWTSPLPPNSVPFPLLGLGPH